MKTRITFLAVLFAGASFGSVCSPSATLAAYQLAGSCQDGAINFSNFAEIGATPANTIGVTLNQVGAAGFTFDVAGGQSTPFMISYTATCISPATCSINDVHDSTTEIPAGGGNYLFSVLASDGLHSSMTHDYNAVFAASNTVVNTGMYLGGGMNQSLTLDVTGDFGSQTPEPTSFFLIAGGLIALGAMKYKGKEANPRTGADAQEDSAW